MNNIYYNLLSQELNNYCDSFFLDGYINPHSFTSKMTEQLVQRNEIKLYVSHILSSSIKDMEEYCEKFITMNMTLDLEIIEECIVNYLKENEDEKQTKLVK